MSMIFILPRSELNVAENNAIQSEIVKKPNFLKK